MMAQVQEELQPPEVADLIAQSQAQPQDANTLINPDGMNSNMLPVNLSYLRIAEASGHYRGWLTSAINAQLELSSGISWTKALTLVVLENGPYPDKRSMIRTLKAAKGVGVGKMKKINQAMWLFSFASPDDPPHRVDLLPSVRVPPPHRPILKKGRPKLPQQQQEQDTGQSQPPSSTHTVSSSNAMATERDDEDSATDETGPTTNQGFKPTRDQVESRLWCFLTAVALPLFARIPGCDSFFAPKAYGFKTPDPINYAMSDTIIHLFSPLDIPATSSFTIRCPSRGCSGTLKNLETDPTVRKGWSKRMRCVVDGHAAPTYLISRLLVCSDCSAHSFQANTPQMLAVYPEFVQQIFTQRFGATRVKKNYSTDFQGRLFDSAACHRSIKSMSDEHNGAVFRHQERVNILFVQHQLADKVGRTQRTLTEYFQVGGCKPRIDVKALEAQWGPVSRLVKYSTGTIDSFDANDATLSAKAFSDMLCACMASLRPRLQVALLINVVLHAVALGADHTFKIVSKGSGSDVYGAMLTIRSNASGAVVSFFVESTTMAEVGQQFKNIALLNDALQEETLKKVAGLFDEPRAIESLSCPLDRFTATYLRHCELLVSQEDGLYQATDGNFTKVAALPLQIIYFDNCCQARNTITASCPQLVKSLPLAKQLQLAPVLPRVFLLEPLKAIEKDLPNTVQCGFVFQAPESLNQAHAEALGRLLAKDAFAFDLEWDTGSGHVTAFILAGVIVMDGAEVNTVFVVNTYGAQRGTFEHANTLLGKIKAAFEDQTKSKFGFCIGNDLKKLESLGFKLSSIHDLNRDPAVCKLKVPKGEGSNRLNVLAGRAASKLVDTKVLQHPIVIPKGPESTSFNQAVFSPNMVVYAGCDGAATHILAAFVKATDCCWKEYDDGYRMRLATAAADGTDEDKATEPIKLDHFHAIQNATKELSTTHPESGTAAKALSDCLFVTCEQSLQTVLSSIATANNITLDQAQACLTKSQSNGLVRLSRNTEDAISRIERWEKVCLGTPDSEGIQLVKNGKSFKVVCDGLKEHLRRGCLSDHPDVEYYVCIGETSSGRLYLVCLRGSNGNESAHWTLAHCVQPNSSLLTTANVVCLASFRLAVESAVTRGLQTDCKHWHLWQSKTFDDSCLALFGKHRYRLPPLDGIELPLAYSDISMFRPSSGVSSSDLEFNNPKDGFVSQEQIAKKAKGFDRTDALRAIGVSSFSSRMRSSLHDLPSEPVSEVPQPRRVVALQPQAMPQTWLDREVPTMGAQQLQQLQQPETQPASSQLAVSQLHGPVQPHAAVPEAHLQWQQHMYMQQYHQQQLVRLPAQALWMPPQPGYSTAPPLRGRRQHCRTCGAPLLGNPWCKGSNCQSLNSSKF
eukprot:m.10369 g.10369  ORF g.10369 m.10369 type:complete len:1366 (+) comp9636_c0_seq3:37-4134(+)